MKQNIQDQVRTTFVEASHITDALPGFTGIARDTVDEAFGAVQEVEFGSELPESEDGDDVARVCRFLDHLDDTVKAAENWQQTSETFRDAWGRLFSNSRRTVTLRSDSAA